MIAEIEITKADITKLKVDAIVNAANASLLGGGGVDGVIHHAAGRGLLQECKKLDGCFTGEAKLTNGYLLPAKYIIHTVGPVWEGGHSGEAGALASCYKQSLKIASENGIKTIAFPNISTGVYHFPKRKAAEIAIKTTQQFLQADSNIEKVIFCCFDDENYELYKILITNEH